MGKLKVFVCRVRNASLSRMKMHIREIHKESGRNSVGIFLDMLWCIARYGVGYLDYHVFGFAYVRGKKNRKTFMTMNDNLNLVHKVNDPAYCCYFKNKVKFHALFRDFTGRAVLDLTTADEADFAQFLQEHGTVFAKPVDDYGGHGVRKLCASHVDDFSTLYRELKESGSVLVEEQIVQHPELNWLNGSCINTLRMVTLLVDGVPHHMYSLIRVGNGQGVVDNISSGGMYAPVWEDGKIAKPAFCDNTGAYYDQHPLTKVPFAGFQVPCYDEAVELVKRAALVVPQVQYVGWDVAISDHGPVLVEGNVIPGYDMCQNYRHLKDDKTGILERFQQLSPKLKS